MQSRRDIHYTPAQATVYINGWLIEDACFIKYDVIDNWTPHYGYNDITYRDVSVGQTIVSGELGIVYRYEGYLTRIIDAALSLTEVYDADSVAAMRQGSARYVSDKLLQTSAAEILTWLDSCSEGDQKAFDKAAEFLKQRFWGAKDLGARTAQDAVGGVSAGDAESIFERREEMNYYRPSILKSPRNLDMRIAHGSENNIAQPKYSRIIKGVQFRGQTYEADIRVPDGSSIITEVYPFIAKDVTPIRLSKTNL